MTDLTNTRLGTEEVVILTILRIQDVGLLGHYHYHLSADTILDILAYVLCSLASASSSYKCLNNKTSYFTPFLYILYSSTIDRAADCRTVCHVQQRAR